MLFKLMSGVEHWRENGSVRDIIDEAEDQVDWSPDDVAEYDCLIEDFQLAIVDDLENSGHKIRWAYRQSVGVGAILQGPFSSGHAKSLRADCLADAIDRNSIYLKAACIRFARCEAAES